MKRHSYHAIALVAIWLTATSASSQEAAPSAPPDADGIRGIFANHCLKCHSGDKPRGELRLDKLAADFAHDGSREAWEKVLARVAAGEMPPEDEPRPPREEIQSLTKWIESSLAAADAARRAEGRTVLRRLNRFEYQNTVRDLLGIEVDLQELLPQDSSAGGFDNVGEALHTSSFLMDRYLDAADAALNAAIANGPQPKLIKQRYFLKNQHVVKSSTESVYRHLDDRLVMFSSSPWNAIVLYEFYPPDRGRYRFRLSVAGYQSGGKPVVFRVDAGPMLMATKNHLVDYFDAPADKPTEIEFTDYLEARSTIRIEPYGLATAHVLNKIGADKYEGPGLAVDWVEVEGPLHDATTGDHAWPPDSHRRVFGDLPQGPAPAYNDSQRVEVVSSDAEADAARILRKFARRAYRRAVTDEDLAPLLKLVQARLAEGRTFEQAIRVGLTAVLVSPDFLFLRERPGRLDDFSLASRLSYFLWSTMPDDELLTLAEQGKLGRPDVLRGQVERLLNDPKSAAFVQNFVDQWLGLRDIDFTMPSHILYPEFDDMLRESMLKEAHLFFAEVLRHDLSLTNFVAADFALLNGRLAKHYGIEGVDGWEFKRTALPPDSHRGGVMTMAGVLKVTANGTTTSPVTRGAWVLDRILGTPAPPPPGDVPAIDPDIRGATTIREQLAKHRELESCASCHVKIDPPGFALESFDVIGGWRDHYRTSGNGKPVEVDGRQMPYLEGPAVDPAAALADGRKFADIDEFKQLLLADKDQLAQAMTRRLLTYATGATSMRADDAIIRDVVDRNRPREYGLRSLVHEIVLSEAFQSK